MQLSVETADKARLTQQFAVLTLYYSTNGPTFWTNKTNQLTEKHECMWFSIWCDGNDVVMEISLLENNLVGTFPADLALLHSLTLLWPFCSANLVGSLPSSIGELANLQYFDVGSCGMSSSLPDAIGNMTSLTDFWISHN